MRRVFVIIIGALILNADLVNAGEVYWYLAASMSRPGREVTAVYNARSPQSRVQLLIGGSGQLLSKIELSRKGGLYTPASTGFLKKAQEKGLVASHRRLLDQVPVFGLSKSGRDRIKSFDDLQQPDLRIALGNPKTMALGASYLNVERKMGEAIAGRIRANASISAMNILQIVNYLKTDVIDAGTIFRSVALSNQLDFVEIPAHYNSPNQAHLIRLALPVENESEVLRFEQFVLTQHDIFKQHGFKLIP